MYERNSFTFAKCIMSLSPFSVLPIINAFIFISMSSSVSVNTPFNVFMADCISESDTLVAPSHKTSPPPIAITDVWTFLIRGAPLTTYPADSNMLRISPSSCLGSERVVDCNGTVGKLFRGGCMFNRGGRASVGSVFGSSLAGVGTDTVSGSCIIMDCVG